MFRGDEGNRALRFAKALVCALACALAAAPGAFALPSDWQRGANVTAWWHNTYEQPQAVDELARLRATGTTHASFIVTWYMDAGTSSNIQADANRTPSDQSLLSAMSAAKSLGMTVTLKPHVDVRDGTFRAWIAPEDPAAWFSDYRSMMSHYSDLADAAGAEMLVVGTELTSMTAWTQQWQALIAEARSRFAGRLTFAADKVSGAKRISFWSQLDYIGIDAYMPLSWQNLDPPVDSLVTSWCRNVEPSGAVNRYFDEIEALHTRFEKPVIFTEIGYQSALGTAILPWGGAAGAISQEAQQRAYEAAYRVWAPVPWFHGIYWWEWSLGKGNANTTDGSHRPSGKLAQNTIINWNLPRDGRTGTPPCKSGPLSGAPSTGARVVRLEPRLRHTRRGRGLRKLAGFARLAGKPCANRAVVKVERWSRRGRRWTLAKSLIVKPQGAAFSVKPRRLPHGRYRARALVARGSCRSARSDYARFKVRTGRRLRTN